MRRHLILVPLLLSATGSPAAAAQERRVVRDPGGLPSWTAEMRSAADGRDCAVLRRGRLLKGRYCERLSASRPLSYIQLRETATDPRDWRTIFVISLARSVTSARLETLNGVKTYVRGRGPRVLLAVLRGNVEQSRVTVRARIGRFTRILSAGRPVTLRVEDPLGGAGWRLAPDTDAAGSERRCVAWERMRSRFGESAGERAEGRPHCGDADAAIPVAFAERVEGRLVITGVVRDDVATVSLRGNDGTRPVRRDADSGEFLAVLPGDVDPDGLTVVATLRDGTRVTQALRTL